MYYLIQENIFKEKKFDELIAVLERAGLPYEIIKWVPFSDYIDFQTDRKDVFCFGSVNMSKCASKYNWVPGVYIDDLDTRTCMWEYGPNMLNFGGKFINYFDPIPDEWEEFFARPSKDTKSFSGGVFTKQTWNSTMDDVDKDYYKDIEVFIAPVKSGITKEIRCWVVGGKVVTISLYKLGRKGFQQNYDHEQEAIDFAQKMANIYSPSKAFVMDICLYEDEYKIVELNSINSAGYYDANMSKLVQALEALEN